MRVRYYSSKKDAATEYDALTKNDTPAMLCGPVPYLITQTSSGKDIEDDVYVVISEFEPAIANVDIPKVPA